MLDTLTAPPGARDPFADLDRPNHGRAPLLDELWNQRRRRTVSFATPGHKRGAGADPELKVLLGSDVFAADLWLNAGDHDRLVGEAEVLAADAWGAERAHFLTNGASSGNQAVLLGTLGPGDEVIVGRDLHRSTLTGLIASGAHPVIVAPALHPDLGLGLGIAPRDVADALDAHPAAKLVSLVSPTYWGVAADVAGIVAVAHARGVPVVVDQAWGPHLPFHPDLPRSALECGADAVVISPHKLLGCLGQGALLLLQGPRLDRQRIAATIKMVLTTSPSLPILASLDACRRQMVRDGERLLERTLALAEEARRRLNGIAGVRVLDAETLGPGAAGFDPTRLVIDVGGLGLTGYAVERSLRDRFAIAPVMGDAVGVVCLVTIGDTADVVDRLVAAFHAIANGQANRPHPAANGVRSGIPPMIAAPIVMSPRDAYFGTSRAVPLAAAAGEAAAEAVVPYPPGIPLLIPGEQIAAEKIAHLQHGLRQGMHVCGPADPALDTIRVVTAFRRRG